MEHFSRVTLLETNAAPQKGHGQVGLLLFNLGGGKGFAGREIFELGLNVLRLCGFGASGLGIRV